MSTIEVIGNTVSLVRYVEALEEIMREQQLFWETNADSTLLKGAIESIQSKNGVSVRPSLRKSLH